MTVIVSPDLTSEKQEALKEKIKKIIEDLKGKVGKINDWGKKKFCYPIRKKTGGCYWFWEIGIPEKEVEKLTQKIKLEEDIFRYLLVKMERRSAYAKVSAEKHGAKIAK